MTKKNTKKSKTTKRVAKKKKSTRTHVVLVLDESASMYEILGQTISGVNEYIDSLRKKRDVLFTLTKFNSVKTEVVQSSVPVADAQKLTTSNYIPDGMTPLYDAVGKAIAALKDTKDSVLVAIVTDGEENSSHEYTREMVASRLKECEKAGWTFVYLGANHDAWAAASSIGVNAENTLQYAKSNVKGAMSGLSTATMRYASDPSAARSMPFFTVEEKNKIGG